jgi:DNA-binding winged helix-turn-helix (wHTH) protein
VCAADNMQPPINQLYKFGQFCLDVSERVLIRDGRVVPLSPKLFDTLLVFIENRGRILGKDELMQMIWPNTFVEESNLTHNISQIRRALGDGEYIETIPRRGYRFISEVQTVRREAQGAETVETGRPKKTGGDWVKLCKIRACPNLRNQTSTNSESPCSGSARSFGDASSSEAIHPSLIYTTLYKSPLAGPTTIFTASLFMAIHGKQYGVAYLGGIVFHDDPRQIKLSDLGLRVKEKFFYEYDFNDQWRHLIRVEAIAADGSRSGLSGLHHRQAGSAARRLRW